MCIVIKCYRHLCNCKRPRSNLELYAILLFTRGSSIRAKYYNCAQEWAPRQSLNWHITASQSVVLPALQAAKNTSAAAILPFPVGPAGRQSVGSQFWHHVQPPLYSLKYRSFSSCPLRFSLSLELLSFRPTYGIRSSSSLVFTFFYGLIDKSLLYACSSSVRGLVKDYLTG